MKCPYCNEEMVQGYVQSRDGVAWSKKKHFMAAINNLLGIDVVNISNLSSNTAATAYHCENCKTVIIPYGKNK